MTRTKYRRIGWTIGISLGMLLLAIALGWGLLLTRHFEPWQFLAHVEQLEAAGVDENSVQPLGWSLAILGRDDEVRKMDFHPRFERPPSTVDIGQKELAVVPWRDAVKEIAARHRLVMIMEHHMAAKHREWIGGTLPTFKNASFTHYAAEALGESAAALKRRGYPASETGLYTADPKFGNLLRRALGLEFEIVGYDYGGNYGRSTHEGREEFAATELAKVLQNDAAARLIVHAGHAHVLKHQTEIGQRWLASILWEKTGIEPFTIWQWSSQQDAGDYAQIVRVLTQRGVTLDEPVVLMPPPGGDFGLRDSPYGPECAARVDAIVIHPPDQSVAPEGRTTLFPDCMRQIAGKWTAKNWPVVVSAYSQGEPVEAIPLDQVMLRTGETEFVLWIPHGAEYEIRVFDRYGLLKSRVEYDGNSVSVGVTAPP